MFKHLSATFTIMASMQGCASIPAQDATTCQTCQPPPYPSLPSPPSDAVGPGWDGPELVPTTGPWAIDYFSNLGQGPAQRTALCGRHHQDRFAQWYCAGQGAQPASMADVLQGLGLRDGNDLTPSTHFALLAASNSLTVRAVSSVNPRGIVYGGDPDHFVATAMARGDGVVEVAAFDPNIQNLHFYLLRAQRPCDTNGSCTFADHFLPANESGWSTVTVYDESDLRDTVVDCLHCHEPAGHNWQTGVGTPRHLLMQERGKPWTHWLRSDTDSSVLLDVFRSVHAVQGQVEDYAGIPAVRLAARDVENHGGDPNILQTTLQAMTYGIDPNTAAFVGAAMSDAHADGSTTPSAAWTALLAQALAGATLPPPFYQTNPFDPSAVAEAVSTYQSPNDAAPWANLAAVYSPEAAASAGITAPAEDPNGASLTARELITFKCGTCHNGRSPGLARNLFDVSNFPDGLSATLKQAIRDRIAAAQTDTQRMPPAVYGDLNALQVQTILDALQ